MINKMAETRITPSCIWVVVIQLSVDSHDLVALDGSGLTIVHESAIAFPLSFSAGRPTNRLPYDWKIR